ncbi:MAG: hypothetical protein ACKPFA_12230, partial [Dolichospermum sp.]
EYAIGSDRMDLCLQYKDVILGIELKVWRDKKRDPQADGIEQLESYLGRLGLDFGWLFIFDRRKNALPMIAPTWLNSEGELQQIPLL